MSDEEKPAIHIGKVARKAIRPHAIDDIAGIRTGIRDLDERLGGLRPGELVMVAGRSSMATSALVIWVADSVSRAAAAQPVLFYSADLTAEELVKRILVAQSGMAPARLGPAAPPLDEDEMAALQVAADDLDNRPLFIDDTPDLAIDALEERVRRHCAASRPALVVIDRLQKLRRPEQKTQAGLPDWAIITRRLKALAGELELPILLTSSVGRSAEQQDGGVPRLQDLAEYCEIEYDADAVALLHREACQLEREEPAHIRE